jgi:hypothetical protein
MKTNNALLAAVLAVALGTSSVAGAGTTDTPIGQIKWFGSIYTKMLDGNRYLEGGLYSNADTTPGNAGGDQGQGTELELLLNVQVSKQVEIGARIHSRFNKNYWTNGGGFKVPGHCADPNLSISVSCESDPLSNQYFKLRGAWARLTPGYEWLDSATIGTNDWGMFDAFTQGKVRYIDRDNQAGILLQGSGLGKKLHWDLARVSLIQYQGAEFTTGELYTNDAAYVFQAKYAPTTDFNATFIYDHMRDKERNPTATVFNYLEGQSIHTRWKDVVFAGKAQYSGLGFADLNGAFYKSKWQVDPSLCDPRADVNTGACRYNPAPLRDTDGKSYYLNVNLNRTGIDGLTVAAQYFFIGADYTSMTAARREQDVLLTSGLESTWQWTTPDLNCLYTQPVGQLTGSSIARCGRPDPTTSGNAGVGYGGWDGEMQQVASFMADNDFTDFNEPVAYSVLGWKGFTVVPKYKWHDWQLEAEFSDIGFDNNWQACGQTTNGLPDKGKCIYPRMEGVHEWGLGGDYRSPFAPYQDRKLQILAFKANYTLDVGKGIDLTFRYKHIKDQDNRATSVASLNDAYKSYIGQNPDWAPNPGLGGCVACDDRRAVFNTYGASGGYQVTPDLYLKLIYEKHKVTLRDGTIDVGPVDFGGANAWFNYLTGEHDKNRFALEGHYFLSGVEFGGMIDYFKGTYDPAFFTNQGANIVRLIPGPGVKAIPTVLGNVSTDETKYKQYRMKVFMKVSF